MPNKKISQMPISTSLTNTMYVPVLDTSEIDPSLRNKRVPKTAFDTSSYNKLIIVKTEADFGVIDSTFEYIIDGIVDITSSIVVPAGGISIKGHSLNVSGLTSSTAGLTMFESAVGGSGDILIRELYISTTGAGSKVYNLQDSTGDSFFYVTFSNYIDCASLGEISGYRQGFESCVARIGGSPFLTLSGNWGCGYKITNLLIFDLSASTPGSVFTAGAGLVFNSRFSLEGNANLPTGSISLCDFTSANFFNISNFQIQNSNITRNGVLNTSDANVIPNILASDVKSKFTNNNGIKNTHEGIRVSTSTEVETTITSTGTYYDILGTTTDTFADHWTKNTGFSATNNTSSPIEYILTVNVLVAGTNGVSVGVECLINGITSFQINRIINDLKTGDDLAIITFTAPVSVKKDTILKLQIANLTNTSNLTVKNSSSMFISKR